METIWELSTLNYTSAIPTAPQHCDVGYSEYNTIKNNDPMAKQQKQNTIPLNPLLMAYLPIAVVAVISLLSLSAISYEANLRFARVFSSGEFIVVSGLIILNLSEWINIHPSNKFVFSNKLNNSTYKLAKEKVRSFLLLIVVIFTLLYGWVRRSYFSFDFAEYTGELVLFCIMNILTGLLTFIIFLILKEGSEK